MSSSLAKVMLITWATHKAGGLTTTHVTSLVYMLPLCLLLQCAASIFSSTHMTTNECLDWSHKRNKEGGAFHFNLGGWSIACQIIYMVAEHGDELVHLPVHLDSTTVTNSKKKITIQNQTILTSLA